ncbi:hypothetical protein POTOM_040899 [Populus tomentosa]|uniref:Uncharacterized protein n=1 Tax=Populus tomentosa TaxID=118781 RepID=A0A8X7YS17_POPTO|nr:hypothetical protein POTOM_040899 [Populus tomentosa]
MTKIKDPSKSLCFYLLVRIQFGQVIDFYGFLCEQVISWSDKICTRNSDETVRVWGYQSGQVKSNIFKRGSDFPATSERASNYRSTDKPIKMDDGHSGELLIKKFSSSRASSRGLADRSPSSSLERRYASKTGVRQSLDIEESTRRSGSICARDLSSAEDRQGQDLPLVKPLANESTLADSSFYNGTNQNNSAFSLLFCS